VHTKDIVSGGRARKKTERHGRKEGALHTREEETRGRGGQNAPRENPPLSEKGGGQNSWKKNPVRKKKPSQYVEEKIELTEDRQMEGLKGTVKEIEKTSAENHAFPLKKRARILALG